MQKKVLGFIVSDLGRVIRIAAGIALVVYGLFFAGSVAGYLLSIAGLAVVATASIDVCFLAGACGLSHEGSQTRAALRK